LRLLALLLPRPILLWPCFSIWLADVSGTSSLVVNRCAGSSSSSSSSSSSGSNDSGVSTQQRW
jgi:hypothetical protein